MLFIFCRISAYRLILPYYRNNLYEGNLFLTHAYASPAIFAILAAFSFHFFESTVELHHQLSYTLSQE